MSRFSSPAAANAAAVALRANGDLAGAIDAFREAVAAFPQTPVLHQNLAQTLYEAGDTAGAIAEHRAVLKLNDRNVASHLALYELLQMTGDPVMALAHQRLALEEQRLFSRRAPNEARSVLFLLAPGDWQANIPVDFLVDPQTTTVHKLYLLDDRYIQRDRLPAYDVMWNAIAEWPDGHGYLDFAERVMETQTMPVLNDPRAVLATSRLRLPDTVRETGVHVPHVVEVRDADLANGKVPLEFPVIARPAGSHAGRGLARLTQPSEGAAYVNEHRAHTYYVSPFVDYTSADGYYRKYRIVFVDGVPYPVHLAISQNWMVHYYNAGMSEDAWKRDEEAAFLADLTSAFTETNFQLLLSVANAVGLEYFGIDAAIDRDGRLLIFEADPAMLVHTTDPIELFPYKHRYIPRIYRAIEIMLDRRKTADS